MTCSCQPNHGSRPVLPYHHGPCLPKNSLGHSFHPTTRYLIESRRSLFPLSFASIRVTAALRGVTTSRHAHAQVKIHNSQLPRLSQTPEETSKCLTSGQLQQPRAAGRHASVGAKVNLSLWQILRLSRRLYRLYGQGLGTCRCMDRCNARPSQLNQLSGQRTRQARHVS